MKVRVEKLPLGISPPEALERLLQLSHPVLLESASKEKEIGRYSLLSAEPFLILKSKGSKTTLYKNGRKERETSKNPFEAVEEELKKYEISEEVNLPFVGGAVGYFSYDLNRHLEELPNWAQDDLNLPDLYLAFYDWGIVYDHFKKETSLVYMEKREAVDKAVQIKKILLKEGKEDPLKVYPKKAKLKSNFNQKSYLEAVKKAKEYIFKGDIFQVNLSQRLEAPLFLSPFSLYKVLQEINPSPFAAFLGFEDSTIVSSSPERFLKVQNKEVETRPIKGTRPRGRNPQEEEKLYWELFFSEKDRAENVMIVDLERNDLGKVCKVGSVKVQELFRVEKYATVLHLVSIVKGILRKNVGLIDLLKATFPGGSITGAPKVRAMEIIEELEPTKRNVYTGSIGYLSFNKRMDLNIAIRTFILKEDTAFFQVGGGIVADSDPEAEYQETMDKAKALIESIKRCE